MAEAVHARQPAERVAVRDSRQPFVEARIVLDHCFEIVGLVDESDIVVVDCLLGLTEYVFNHETGTIFELNCLAVFEFKSTLAMFATAEGRRAAQPPFELLMAVNLVAIVRAVNFEGGYWRMVRHLLAVYPLASGHLALQGLAEDRVQGHLAVCQRLVDVVAGDEECDHQLDSFERVAEPGSLVQVLQADEVVLYQVQLRPLPVNVRRRGYLDHVQDLPFESSRADLRSNMLDGLDDFALLVIEQHAALPLFEFLRERMQGKSFILIRQFLQFTIRTQFLDLVGPIIDHCIVVLADVIVRIVQLDVLHLIRQVLHLTNALL